MGLFLSLNLREGNSSMEGHLFLEEPEKTKGKVKSQ